MLRFTIWSYFKICLPAGAVFRKHVHVALIPRTFERVNTLADSSCYTTLHKHACTTLSLPAGRPAIDRQLFAQMNTRK